MILHLELAAVETESVAQVCVIGAGTAGIFLARQLRQRNIQVVVLEAGDETARTPSEFDQQCEQIGIRYGGAEAGRSFCLGGTSVLWGGQLLPLTASDMGARPNVGIGAWPVDHPEVSAYFGEVGRAFGIEPDIWNAGERDAAPRPRSFAALEELSADFELRLSAWLPFRKRNFARAFADDLRDDDGLTIWLHAAVTSLERDSQTKNARIESVVARSPNGRTLRVRASVVVVCAGALESTRLLLAFDEATGGSISAHGAPLGRYFADHLSVTCARIRCHDWSLYNHLVAPIFAAGLMRTPRLELSALAQDRLAMPSAFAHFTFRTNGDTGFDMVRNFLRRYQGEANTTRLAPRHVANALVDLSGMLVWRSLYRKLWIPRRADLLLQVDIEQAPNPNSRLMLSDQRDDFGRKRLVIDWRISNEDIDVIRKVADLVVSGWESSSLRDVADMERHLPDRLDSFESLYDVYHPTGTLRMGTSISNSVVDKDLKLWATDNCFVSTTAVFPSAGSANPGLTHLALTARLAERVATYLRLPAL